LILKSGFILLVITIVLFQFSCKTEDEVISDNPGYYLSFSNDTISFDTIFTSLGSVTKRLIVRNPNPNALNIEKIYVGHGQESPYTITVSGNVSNWVENQLILGHDSLLVLVSVTIDPSDETIPFIVRDSIVFETNGNIQDIKLQSWGQNAHFLGDSILSCNSIWTPDLPYFLYGSILVDSLCELTVEKGVRVFSSFDTFIFIKGTFRVNGEPQERVIFRNERFEQHYENLPGQWGGILFLEGSNNNRIEYTDIRNMQYGIRIGSPDNDTIPDLVLKHVRIENSAIAGIAAYTSDLLAENTLINTSAGYVIGNFAGGNYTYNHCTFANYPVNFFIGQPVLIVTDYIDLDDGTQISDRIILNLLNSIVWGYHEEEIVLNFIRPNESDLGARNSILKTSLNIFEGEGNFLSINKDFMQFNDVENYDYAPDSLSPAINNALGSTILDDLYGQQRDSLPDIGAIEYILPE